MEPLQGKPDGNENQDSNLRKEKKYYHCNDLKCQ